MGTYSILPFVGCMGILFAVAATPLFSAADTAPGLQPHRLNSLDGLRGILALSVFFHHAAVYQGYLATGRWEYPPSRFYQNLGPVAVEVFFMITGYLFWTRLLRQQGRPGWARLYIARIFRIGPVWLLAFSCMALIALTLTHFHLRVSALALVRQISVALALGVISLRDINGYMHTDRLLDDVTWTLQFEWMFYLSLPLLVLATFRTRRHLPITALLFSLSLIALILIRHLHPSSSLLIQRDAGITCLFAGMLVASLRQSVRLDQVPQKIASALLVVLMIGVLSFGQSYSALSTIVLAACFYLIIDGCNAFGLLLSKPARRLGDISYGIYLLQGLPQLLFRVPFFRSVMLASAMGHWSIALLAAVILIAVALATHVLVELPGIELGKRLSRSITGKSTPGAVLAG